MGATEPARVVVVDDAVEIRELLRYTLDRSPHFAVVGEAADGATGVEAVVETTPDLVLLDISMPVMDGLTALRIIRAQAPETVVVMFSAFGDIGGAASEAVRLGAHGFIRKGDRWSVLVEQLRAMMGAAAEPHTRER